MRLPALFDALNDVDRATALRHFEERTLPSGRTLFEEGASADHLVCVVSGELEIRSGDVRLALAHPGDLVGEMALFERSTRIASVRARGETTVLLLSRDGYDRLRDVMHPLGVILEKAALALQIERMRTLGDRIAQLAEGTPIRLERPTARFFAAIAEIFGAGGTLPAQEIVPIATLAKSPIFKGAPLDALKQIAPSFTAASFRAGHLICTEGERGSEMYLLAAGEVDVVVATGEGRVQHLATLQPGAAFGMIGLEQGRPRMASCVARTPVSVLVLGEEGWQRLVAEPAIAGSAFRRALLKGMSEQIAFTNKQLADFQSRAGDHGLLRVAGAGVETHPLRR